MRIYYIILYILIFYGCNSNKKESFFVYIENNCNFKNCDTCFIDTKDYFKVDFDTMYVFGEYTNIQGIRLILKKNNYINTNYKMPQSFLVEDSFNKIILLKDNKIIFDKDMKYPYFYNDGIEVSKKGIFDGEPYTHYAKLFTSSRFMVVCEKQNKKNYYYRNVQADGTIIPFENIK